MDAQTPTQLGLRLESAFVVIEGGSHEIDLLELIAVEIDARAPRAALLVEYRAPTQDARRLRHDDERRPSIAESSRLEREAMLGDAPGEPSGVPSLTHVLGWEVSAEVFSTVREAMAKLRRDAGEPLDDDAALLLMARHVLGGPADAGRASYQVSLTVCEECRRGWQQGAGVSAVVGPEIVAMACCDAQHLGRIPLPIDAAADMGHAASACSDARMDAGRGSAMADGARVADVPAAQVDRTTAAIVSPPGVAVHTDPSTSHVGNAFARRLPVPDRRARARQDVPPVLSILSAATRSVTFGPGAGAVAL